MHLKGGLHIHTTCSDGELTIVQAIRVYERLGFDFIALTDHDFLMKKECYKDVAAVKTDMIVFCGVEKTVFDKGYVHINQISGPKETLNIFNHPSELDLPLGRVIERITGLVQTHPIDAVEVTSKGFRFPEYETDQLPFPKVATDDSHNRL
ncbi:MAG: PHP domain-containing protein [Desulfobacter sp.]|nr:MAG: PHP domain-containing protein [Desulfobacter sp.]